MGTADESGQKLRVARPAHSTHDSYAYGSDVTDVQAWSNLLDSDIDRLLAQVVFQPGTRVAAEFVFDHLETDLSGG